MSNKTPAPTFSAQDARNMIGLVQRAPLQNLQEAANVSTLLDRFTAWYEYVTKPTDAAPPARAPRKTPASKGGQGSPDGQQSQDPSA